MADARTRHGRGLIIVIVLAVIFFTILALIILRTGGESARARTASETLTVLPVRIRIRTAPNARAAVVTTASAGERLSVLEDRGGWVKVKTREGLIGWADRSSLERTAEQQRRLARYQAIRKLPPLKGVVSARTPLYSGPGIFYSIVGEIGEGGEVTVFTRDHDFYAIEYGTAIAYADVDAIDVTSSGSLLEVATAETDTRIAPAVPPTATQEPPSLPPSIFPTTPETAEREEPEPETSNGVFASVPRGGTQPRELDRVIPRYPAAARRAGVEGAVVIRGVVRRDGTIDNLEVIKDLPYGLGEEARRAVSRWRFEPATYRGEPIDVYYTVTVNFRMR